MKDLQEKLEEALRSSEREAEARETNANLASFGNVHGNDKVCLTNINDASRCDGK